MPVSLSSPGAPRESSRGRDEVPGGPSPALPFSLTGTFPAPFPESFMPSSSPWTVALAVALPALLLLVTGSICLIRKLCGEKEITSTEKEFENKEKETARKELGRGCVEKEKERLRKGRRGGG